MYLGLSIASTLVLAVHATTLTSVRFGLPVFEHDISQRLKDVAIRRQGYLYGPSRLGNLSFFPAGPLGDRLVLDNLITSGEANAAATDAVDADTSEALRSVKTVESLEDYYDLYKDHWKRSIPTGPAVGALSNGSTDLQFSMERLSASPYSVRRLHPIIDDLPFPLDVDLAVKIAGLDLETLHKEGRLFFSDHAAQLLFPKTERYSAACSAYFFIHPESNDFLPLAIRTNTEHDLVYTPLDTPNDWLLAKIMMNSNEAVFNEVYHVAATHAVQEIVYLAALRTLHDNHPVLKLMERFMHSSYASRARGGLVLTNEGGIFDRYFSITGQGAELAMSFYYNSGGGAFQANYLVNNLESRGLINCTYGPALKTNPFFQDASQITLALRRFVRSFIYSYYKSDVIVTFDFELQDWVHEATVSAKVVDFPQGRLTNRETLIDILCHFAFLTVIHNTLHGASPVKVSSTLPYHPAALHAPLPAKKGVDDILPWLPNRTVAISEIALFAQFNQPFSSSNSSTFGNILQNDVFLSRLNEEGRIAEQAFRDEMETISGAIKSKAFDQTGLCQGMPFLWTLLDPATMHGSSSV